MADDGRLARLEERMEQFVKRLDRSEDALDRHTEVMEKALDVLERRARQELAEQRLGMKEQFASLEKLMRQALGAAVEIQDAKNNVFRTVAVAILLALISAVVGVVVTNLTNASSRLLPQQAPYHSTQEPHERRPQ